MRSFALTVVAMILAAGAVAHGCTSLHLDDWLEPREPGNGDENMACPESLAVTGAGDEGVNGTYVKVNDGSPGDGDLKWEQEGNSSYWIEDDAGSVYALFGPHDTEGAGTRLYESDMLNDECPMTSEIDWFSFFADSPSPTIEEGAAADPPTEAPGNLTATPGDQQVQLLWERSSEDDPTSDDIVDEYSIRRGTTQGGSKSEVATVNATQVSGYDFNDTGLTNDTTYYYVVVPVNSGGDGPASDEIAVTPRSIELALHVTRTSDLMDPAVVQISVDRDQSSVGDDSHWDECRIDWKIEGPVGSLPERYRYVTDPRDGRAKGEKIDLTAEGVDLSNSDWSPVTGFNIAPVLVEGSWEIKARLTNKSGTQSAVVAQQVTVDADTREEVHVDSVNGDDDTGDGTAGNPWATLAHARSEKAHTHNLKYVIAGDHDETLDSRLNIQSANVVVQWDQAGSKPIIRGHEFRVRDYDVAVIDGIARVPLTAGDDDGFQMIEDDIAFIDCEVRGDGWDSDRRFSRGFFTFGRRVLVLNSSDAGGLAYSFSAQSGGARTHMALVGVDFEPNRDEASVRTVGNGIENWSVLWSRIAGRSGFKDSLRYNRGYALSCGYSRLVERHLLLGWGASIDRPSRYVRIEGNQFEKSGVLIHARGRSYTLASNWVRSGVGDQRVRVTDADASHIRLLRNTLEATEDAEPLHVDADQTVNLLEWHGNLFLVTAGTYTQDGIIRVDYTSAIKAAEHNVYTPPGDVGASNLRIGHTNDTLTEWQNRDVTSGEQAADVSLDAHGTPEPAMAVSVPDGVFSDYYGVDLTGASDAWAGAVADYADELGAPQNLEAAPLAPTEIALAWDPPVADGGFTDTPFKITGYRIERRSPGGSGEFQIVTTSTGSTATSYVDKGLAAETNYEYRVRAITASQESDWSNLDDAPTEPPYAPGPPTELTATLDGDEAVDLAWTAPADDGGAAISDYRLEMSYETAAGDPVTEVIMVGSDSTSHRVTGLDPGTQHCFTVQAVNSAGAGEKSNEECATTPAAPGEPGGASEHPIFYPGSVHYRNDDPRVVLGVGSSSYRPQSQ